MTNKKTKLQKLKDWMQNNLLIVGIISIAAIISFVVSITKNIDYLRNRLVSEDKCSQKVIERENTLSEIQNLFELVNLFDRDDALDLKRKMKKLYNLQIDSERCFVNIDTDRSFQNIKNNIRSRLTYSISKWEDSYRNNLENQGHKEEIIELCHSFQIICEITDCTTQEIEINNRTLKEFTNNDN